MTNPHGIKIEYDLTYRPSTEEEQAKVIEWNHPIQYDLETSVKIKLGSTCMDQLSYQQHLQFRWRWKFFQNLNQRELSWKLGKFP